MKKNMLKTMVRLDIDPKIRELIGQLWKHNYSTLSSCQGGEGHGSRAYILLNASKGDGWLEKNLEKYELVKAENGDCCNDNRPIARNCKRCGAGVHGSSVYTGSPIK